MNQTPIYPYPITYAREHGELEQYRASLKTLAECKCAIDDAIFDNWDGMNFDTLLMAPPIFVYGGMILAGIVFLIISACLSVKFYDKVDLA